ncbi:MAG: dihydrodipicolinate synthase family protein [Chitinophagaceae bacterium]|nr:dihydrodipicolinate synthase family protein [Chitinophagaceae bacterium]
MPKKFVPVMITPFTPDARIDFEMLEKLIDFYLAAGVKGLFANCQSSEMFSITNEERLALTKAVVKHVNGRVPIVASGSFGLTVKDKAEFTKRIYDTGIDAVVLITSHFAAIDEGDDKLLQRLEKLLSMTGDVPLGLYECPAPYKRLVTPGILKTLIATNRMRYHKDTSCSKEQVKAKLEATRGSSMQFFDAHTPNAISSMQAGADGMSAISGNFYPEVLVWLCENVDNPYKQKEVEWLQSELIRVDPLIHQAYPMSSKYFLKERGLPIHLISRAQTFDPTPEQKNTLQSILKTFRSWCEKLDIRELAYESVA